jgi:hypothetical protein
MVAFREALLTKVPAAWRQPLSLDGMTINEASQSIELVLRTFMTAGSAAASWDRFDLIGRWANVPKRMRVHTPGPKRRLIMPEDCDGNEDIGIHDHRFRGQSLGCWSRSGPLVSAATGSD